MSNFRTAVFAVAAMGMAATAHAVEIKNTNFSQAGTFGHAPVFERTLPPVGFVQFCARYRDECRPTGGNVNAVELTPKTWEQLREVNAFVNESIIPVSDEDLYQEVERWEYPDTAGDCEDYVLLKKRYLEGLGFPAETLLITVVLDEVGQGHAVLTVRTTKGDFILDNRRNEISRWADTGYEFLKRQSQANPQEWVSLTSQSRRNQGSIAGAN